MKILFLICSLLFASIARADSIPYTQKTVKSYLANSEMVALVYKLDGYISFSEYYEILSRFSEESEKDIYERWKANKRKVDDLFLVVKDFNSEENLGSYVTARVSGAARNITEIGNHYLVFFRKSELNASSALSYSICDVVLPEQITERVKKSMSQSELINLVVANRLLGCYILDQ